MSVLNYSLRIKCNHCRFELEITKNDINSSLFFWKRCPDCGKEYIKKE